MNRFNLETRRALQRVSVSQAIGEVCGVLVAETKRMRCARMLRLFLTLCLASAVIGCGSPEQIATTESRSEMPLPVVRGSELAQYLRASELPVLVEFGVDVNCSRCAQTKNGVERLRESLHGSVDVVRVDFSSNAQTVAKLGGTICPTYVLFDGTKNVLTRSFPVSIGLLEGEVMRQIGK
ncbi:MAG: hypothetical protein GY748_07790 [Planctomycetaceae bacterium]|nr:hypothetical protein [Planctomycetaceae bacterium]